MKTEDMHYIHKCVRPETTFYSVRNKSIDLFLTQITLKISKITITVSFI